ncbi:TIR domain protein [compost metagenome]
MSVWYDEYTLRIGDSLRRSIDKGLAESKYGLIILSKAFFEKNWTQYELNGLVVKEMEGSKVILPIWHNITKNEIMRLSPSLVDKVALNSATLTVREIAEKIADAVKHA